MSLGLLAMFRVLKSIPAIHVHPGVSGSPGVGFKEILGVCPRDPAVHPDLSKECPGPSDVHLRPLGGGGSLIWIWAP